MLSGQAFPEVTTRVMTTNFWRDLPGPLVIALTFLICGFVIVYFFGGRGFCRYGCPYGVLFGIFDRIAPGKIREAPGCVQCGLCTAACTSHVRVHEELHTYGMVVDPRCLKDLDCVSVCPQKAVRFGFGRPTVAKKQRETPKRPRYDFSIPEEIAMVLLFAISLYTWRGLYDRLPFLMSLALSGITAYLGISFARLFYRRSLSVNRYRLKIAGRLLRAGRVFAVLCGAFLLFAGHSTFVQYHRRTADRLLSRAAVADRADQRALLEQAVQHLKRSDSAGLVSTPSLEMALGGALMQLGRPGEASEYYGRAVDRQPNYPEARVALAKALVADGRWDEAESHFRYVLQLYSAHQDEASRMKRVYATSLAQLGTLSLRKGQIGPAEDQFRHALAIDPDRAEAHFGLGFVASQQGRLGEAIEHYRRAIELDANLAEAHANLGDVLVASNNAAEAIDEYEAALRVDPTLAGVHFKLGVLNFHTSQLQTATRHFAIAVEESSDDPQVRRYFGLALEQTGDIDAARRELRAAVKLDPNDPDTQFHLGRLEAAVGHSAEASVLFRRAVTLDPRYQEWITSWRRQVVGSTGPRVPSDDKN